MAAAQDALSGSLRQHVSFLSASLTGGRRLGSTGAQEAAGYILRTFRDAGLEVGVQAFAEGDRVGHNLIGTWRGNPRSRTSIVLTAHYDGIGTPDGRLFPGADSNASGVAALLVLAQRLSGSGQNYVFVALDGHHASLAGAEQYARTGAQISLLVNLDTMGSTLAPPYARKDYLIILGAGGMAASLLKANMPVGLRLYFDYYGSPSFTDFFYQKMGDQAPFLRRKVPAVMFTSGVTLHTNKVSDTAETLDYAIFARRVLLIGNWLENL